MRVTHAKIEANRRNAQRSTGPKTDAGKQTAARNAITHGFLARIVPDENADFHQMLVGLLHSLRPADQMQRLLVEQIALAFLRLRRLLATERDAACLPGLQQAAEQYKREHQQEILDYAVRNEIHPDLPQGPLVKLVQAAAPLAAMEGFLEAEGTKLRIRYEAMLSRQIQRSLDLLFRLQAAHSEGRATPKETERDAEGHTFGFVS